ncbi:hypothetical protein [Gordonia otitidis]|uniref:Uncharacterized protein n=1 Tax=Gordonia otitidis (strain DSM 44809 / CCUG 52243 / JCM 12355 / NBRC 100426 / IFM 10032) TaxID=1108044 RepID=H5TKY1_GORO1|nr:hypothetical protein [Gordonia otitidis]GAB34139.1 hypothetical protein GOOTI_095_00150 [Gordonia otitidis NBRC 100426]
MTVMDSRLALAISPADDGGPGCDGCCGSCESAVHDDREVPAGFDDAIAMAEAAALHNPTRWNEIRTHASDSAVGEYCSSMLLGALLQSAAHRLGVPAADVWSYVRRTGELPL